MTRPSRSMSFGERYDWQRAFLAVIGGITLIVAVGHFRDWKHKIPLDLQAFYCGGKVVLHHQDPYHVEPLLDCERQLASGDPEWHDYVAPVPLPPYCFLFLALLAALPVHTATIVFGILTLLATAITAYALSRLSPFPLPLAFLLAYFGTTYVGSSLGQLAPLAIAALALSTVFLRYGQPKMAALAACAALVQPQFALPSVLALFLFVPATRAVLSALLLFLTALSFGLLGFHATLEYPLLLQVHGRSELGWAPQYSAAWLAHALGAGTTLSLLVGTTSTIALLSWCFLLLNRYRKEAVASGAVLLLPAAYAVAGGTFIHSHQISVAFLAAVVLLRPSTSLLNPTVAGALLVIPFAEMATRGGIGGQHWPHASTMPSIALAILAAWYVVYYPMRVCNLALAARQATYTTIFIVGAFFALIALRPLFVNTYIHVTHVPHALASTEWASVVNTIGEKNPATLFFILVKLPTWLAMGIILWSASRTFMRVEPLSAARCQPNETLVEPAADQPAPCAKRAEDP